MKKYCQNCYHPLTYKAKFCAHCGQKVTDGKVGVGDLMQQLWFRVLHLESRSWRVLWRLFIPGQVSIDYFSGKRKRYPPPVQFFFVIMFFFLLLLNHLVGDTGHIGFKETDKGFQVNPSDTITPPADLYELGQRYTRMQRLRSEFDSLPPEYRTPEVRAALDSIFQRTDGDVGEEMGKVFAPVGDTLPARAPDSLSFSLGIRKIRVSVMDLFELPADSIITKYHLSHWADKVLIRQGIKSVKEPKALLKTYIGSLAWTLLALVALMSGVLTLLYWRRRRYYVEHFIFLLHQHTGIFLLLTASLFVNQFYRLPKWFWVCLITWIVLSPLLAMHRYYSQGWLKTFAKWLIFFFAYLAGFVILFISSMLFVFFIF
jgi:hypothetical protein